MVFGGHVYQQTVDISMGTNCLRNKKKTSLHLTFRYADYVLSLNNPKFNYYLIYLEELEIKGTTEFGEDG